MAGVRRCMASSPGTLSSTPTTALVRAREEARGVVGGPPSTLGSPPPVVPPGVLLLCREDANSAAVSSPKVCGPSFPPLSHPARRLSQGHTQQPHSRRQQGYRDRRGPKHGQQHINSHSAATTTASTSRARTALAPSPPCEYLVQQQPRTTWQTDTIGCTWEK